MGNKKVLFLTEDISFTFNNRVIRETEVLLKDGWDISIVCPKGPNGPFYKKISNSLRVYFYPRKDVNASAKREQPVCAR